MNGIPDIRPKESSPLPAFADGETVPHKLHMYFRGKMGTGSFSTHNYIYLERTNIWVKNIHVNCFDEHVIPRYPT